MRGGIGAGWWRPRRGRGQRRVLRARRFRETTGTTRCNGCAPNESAARRTCSRTPTTPSSASQPCAVRIRTPDAYALHADQPRDPARVPANLPVPRRSL